MDKRLHADDVPRCVKRLRETFNSGKTRPAAWRRYVRMLGVAQFVLTSHIVYAKASQRNHVPSPKLGRGGEVWGVPGAVENQYASIVQEPDFFPRCLL